ALSLKIIMLFSSIIRDHERRKKALHALEESETVAALDKVPQLADSLVDLANVDVSQIYERQLEVSMLPACCRAGGLCPATVILMMMVMAAVHAFLLPSALGPIRASFARCALRRKCCC
ncbi:hypothetical protein Vretifemale_20103, partial [Volvox reticuliferus]